MFNRKTACQNPVFWLSLWHRSLWWRFNHIPYKPYTHISSCFHCQQDFQVEHTAYLEYLHQLYSYNFSVRELEKDFFQENCKINDA